MQHTNETALAVAHILSHLPTPRMTVIAKARFDLRPDGPVALSEEPAVLTGDEVLEGFTGQLRYASDLVPFKPKADVMLVGADPSGKRQRLRVGDHRFEGGGDATVSPFAPLAHDAPSRFAKLGTYDEAWVKERWPWFPADFDSAYFNAAAPSLQVDYLTGDETLELANIVAGQAKLATALPGRRVRCFLDEVVDGEERFREVRLNLDTLWIDAETQSLTLVWRGIVDVADEEASQVRNVVWAEEILTEPAKPLLDYQQQLRIASMPKAPAAAAAAPAVNDNEPQPEEISEREKAALEALHDKLENLGAPAEMLALVRQAERMADAMEALSNTVDRDPAVAQSLIAEAEQKIRERLKEAGHELPEDEAPAPKPVEAPTPWTRQRVELAMQASESMAGADLCGLDLSELDLSSADLHGALLRGANLTGSKLYDADLREASLAGANIAGAVLGLAKLTGADLNGVAGAGADFRRADLSGAILDEATLTKAMFDDASAAGASFRRADLCGATFRKAELETARFVQAILHDASFEAANLTRATLRTARGENISFKGARLTQLRAGDGSLFAHADLSGADADGSIWMGADLQQANVVGASLRRADLSRTAMESVDLTGSNCANADFTESDLGKATLAGANFAGARFTSANLERADARNANFYEAELWKASLRGLQLEGAHVAMSKLGGRDV